MARQVRAIIGTHGGGMYNVLFVSPGTSVIEIRPQQPGQKPLGGTLFWELSSIKNLTYWSFASATNGPGTDTRVDCDVVAETLQAALSEDYATRLPVLDRWYQGGFRPTFR